jgi:hypothetical protein
MKSSIRNLSEKLSHYPDARCQIEEDRIEVSGDGESEFSVALYDCGKELIVSYGGWHDHFTDEEEALRCFAFGLSRQCRLKVYSRGEFEYKWTVQSQENGGWQDIDTTGLLFFPIWRKMTVKYLQNTLLHCEEWR